MGFASRSHRKSEVRDACYSVFVFASPFSDLFCSLPRDADLSQLHHPDSLNAQASSRLWQMSSDILGGKRKEEWGHLFPFLISCYFATAAFLCSGNYCWVLITETSRVFLLLLVHKCFTVACYQPGPHLCKQCL